MEIVIVALGFIGLAIVALGAMGIARPRRRTTKIGLFRPSLSPTRFVSRGSARWSSNWFASDPVLYVGVDAPTADCGAAGDGGAGGGGSRD